MPNSLTVLQMLGRNLEALVTRAQELQKEWKDEFTSVEHLLLAMLDDQHFGQQLLRDEGWTRAAWRRSSRRSGAATGSPTRSVLGLFWVIGGSSRPGSAWSGDEQ